MASPLWTRWSTGSFTTLPVCIRLVVPQDHVHEHLAVLLLPMYSQVGLVMLHLQQLFMILCWYPIASSCANAAQYSPCAL